MQQNFNPVREEPGLVSPTHVHAAARGIAVRAWHHEERERLTKCIVGYYLYRGLLADFIGAKEDEVVLVPNATHGLNTVLRNFEWREGDILLGSA